jgi:hypothetical protein
MATFATPPRSASDQEPERRRPEPGEYKGRHYTAWVDDVKQLEREKRYEEADTLLIGLVAAARAEADEREWTEAPWYEEQLAIVRRHLEREKKGEQKRARENEGDPSDGQE